MNDAPAPPPALAPAPLPDAPLARSLRLVALGSAPVLLASATYSATPPLRTAIWALPLAGKGPSGAVANLPQLLPVPPRWDAAFAEDGSLSFVLEVAGGAMNALIQTDGNAGRRTSLSAYRPFASFTGPRLVRGADAVSAVVDDATAVVLESTAAGTVEHPIAACSDVVVLAGSPGPTAVCKRVAPGAARGGAMPGAAHVLPLDSAYRPAGAEAAPFGERRVFELDADRDGAGIVVVATTGANLLVAHRPSPDVAFRVVQVDPGGADPRTFSAPCVVVTDHVVTLAVLSNALTPGARALVATWPISSAP